ncbi:uncharacterized protein B0I36DRAFT_366735 [Microdochium trichocladiopsis]|uniref:Alpha-L-rhamnosidase six-hairpin glycosidase domain-containing protein n=1 Tax=Microdochium trichocladiopsis TaxID=1682393 RepID=A0A9P8XXX2_9PEZI|nr:uncharacterized protein B0I36DRAFT_366735 [Microdochium trichocladiopsis]KAH7024827.1 hypothetical protein B0I36DRAFT_366735 [Microdochium trichocladiopsis]
MTPLSFTTALVLDHGVKTECIPSFGVVATAGDTSVLGITYSETEPALGATHCHGHLPRQCLQHLGARKGPNRLILRGFRYQKLNLSSAGEITLLNVGVISTVHSTFLTELPGSFADSDSSLNKVWSAGARTLQHSEIPKNSAHEFWQVTNNAPADRQGLLRRRPRRHEPTGHVGRSDRRDRIAYTGNLDIAGAAALASTDGLDFILGTLELFGPLQARPGFFNPTVKIQQGPSAPMNFNKTGLIRCSWNLLTALAMTYNHTGDVAFARTWAPKVQAMLDWTHYQVLPSRGLFSLSEPSFGSDWNYYDPVRSGVVRYFNVAYAYALQETARLVGEGGIANAAAYQDYLAALRTAHRHAALERRAQRAGFAQDANAVADLTKNCDETCMDLCPFHTVPFSVGNTGTVKSDFVR